MQVRVDHDGLQLPCMNSRSCCRRRRCCPGMKQWHVAVLEGDMCWIERSDVRVERLCRGTWVVRVRVRAIHTYTQVLVCGQTSRRAWGWRHQPLAVALNARDHASLQCHWYLGGPEPSGLDWDQGAPSPWPAKSSCGLWRAWAGVCDVCRLRGGSPGVDHAGTLRR